MKLNVLLPWICAVGLGAGLASVFVSSRAKDAELTRLRAETAQAQQQLTQLDESQTRAKALAEQVAELRKDNQELLKLRSEVGQLRTEKQKLTQQVQAVQTQVQLAQSHAEQAMKAGSDRATELAKLQNEMQARMKMASSQNEQRIVCINQLRQLDAAKQQWALENNKTADATPTAQEIAAYLPGNVVPGCPAGGTYLLNALNQRTACSVQGHASP